MGLYLGKLFEITKKIDQVNYFSLLFSDYSVALYSLIFIVGSFLAFKSQQVSDYGTLNVRKGWFFASFLFLWFFFAFNDVGADTGQYRILFEYSDTNQTNYYTGAVESGYIYINYLVHFITNDPVWGIVIIRTIQFALVYLAIFMVRDRIIIGFAVMCYAALFYFGSFNILRLALASSVCMVCYACVVRGYSKYLIVFLAVIPFFIHRSSIIFSLTLFLWYLYQRFHKSMGTFARIAMMGGCIFILAYGTTLMQDLMASGFSDGRYDNYLDTNGTRGVMVIIFYAPLLYFMFSTLGMGSKYDQQWTNLSFIFTLMSFTIAVMAYQVGMLTRMAAYLCMPMMYYMSYVLLTMKTGTYIQGMKLSIDYRSGYVLCILYFIFRFVLNIEGSYIPDGLMDFHLIF